MLIIFNLRRYKKIGKRKKPLTDFFWFIMSILLRSYEIEVDTLSADFTDGVILHFD